MQVEVQAVRPLSLCLSSTYARRFLARLAPRTYSGRSSLRVEHLAATTTGASSVFDTWTHWRYALGEKLECYTTEELPGQNKSRMLYSSTVSPSVQQV